jgi:hypothetical protein
MGAVFVLGGLGFAVVGGLLYYFLSKTEESDGKQVDLSDLTENTPAVEVHRLF